MYSHPQKVALSQFVEGRWEDLMETAQISRHEAPQLIQDER
jgi:hypothetical protein